MRLVQFVLIALVSQLMVMNAACQAVDSNAVSNEQFKKAAADTNAVILDVRTPEEFKEGHIPGSINYNMLDEEAFRMQIATLPKNKKYLLYCRSGKRSLTALNMMVQNGFVDVKHLGAGIKGWDGEVIQ